MSAATDIPVGVPWTRRMYGFLLVIFAIVFLLSTAWFVYALSASPSETLWGSFLVSFIFLLGISQFGICFVAIMRICNAGWSRVYYRAAELATLAFLPFAFAGLLYIYFKGSPYLLYWLNEAQVDHHTPWLDSHWLLWRNLFAQSVFYLVAIGYFLTGLLPDITRADAEDGPGWRRSFYGFLLSLQKNRDAETLKRNVYLFSPAVLITAILANTFIAWDFGMMLVPHYHSTVFPMYYIMGNMFAGSAALLIIAVILGRFFPLQEIFRTVHVQSMAILLTGFALLWMYLFWAQFFVSWFGNLEHEYGVLVRHYFGHYSIVFSLMIGCIFVIPLFCLVFVGFKRSWWTMTLLAVIINIGVWLNRYIIILPALATDHYPLSSFVEITMPAGLVAGYLLLLFILFHVFPVLCRWELRTVEDKEKVAQQFNQI